MRKVLIANRGEIAVRRILRVRAGTVRRKLLRAQRLPDVGKRLLRLLRRKGHVRSRHRLAALRPIPIREGSAHALPERAGRVLEAEAEAVGF